MNESITALYIRLSQEDENIGESNSVKHQRDLLTDFALNHPELSKSKLLYFIDDGYSGTNFNRPAVTDMLDRVKKGEIKTVVVKDFSRFGRNYIDVGGYLEQIFPFLRVRFLSVNDFFDSNDMLGSSAGISLGFKTILHDMYSKDLSIKSLSGKMAKTKRGQHVNGTAPFGYVKSKTVKNAWEIDEPAAATVRKIFDLALKGLTVCSIAKQLNIESLPAPLAYRIANNTEKGVHCRKVDETPIWRMANVTKIVRDERYVGKLITGTKKRVKVGGRQTVPVPKNEWIVIPNAHEPIITQETYDSVQEILGAYNVKSLTRDNSRPMAGKVFCGHCKHALRFYRGINARYICQSHRETQTGACFTDMIYEADIKEIVLLAINNHISLATAETKQNIRHKKTLRKEHEKKSDIIKKLSADVQREKQARVKLYEEYIGGKLTEAQFLLNKSEKSDVIKGIEEKIAKLSDELQSYSTPNADLQHPFDVLKSYTEVTHEVMALVSGIYVYDSTHIEIKFAFKNYFTE